MFRFKRFPIVVGLLGLLVLSHTPLQAASVGTDAGWCGTWDWGIEVALAKHERNLRRVERDRLLKSGGVAPLEGSSIEIGQNGRVAVINDDGSLVVDQSLFDYEDRGAKFIRRGKNGYKIKSLGGSVRADLGDRLGLGDDDAVRIDLGDLEIRYFGKRYSSVFVNSDGNLTFGESDTASTARDIQRFLNGPPRVAPFFADLDPSAADGDGGVYVRQNDSKITVTWWRVPEFGTTNSNTFQLVMNRRGNVEVRFEGMDALEGIVGVSPGGGGGLELVDLTEDLPIKRKGVAMAERFTQEESLDEASVAAAFYQAYADDYDQLVMFTDFGFRAEENAIAYHLTVQNRVRGIGKSVYDGSRFFGSSGRLEGFVNMGGEIQYSANVTRPSFWNVYSATDILAHELGHQWLVSATFVDSQGRESSDLLGRGNAHWDFYFDSDLSFMEGNEIRDDGNGRFTTLSPRATYNPFDRYLMGLLPATDVPGKFYVQPSGGGVPGANDVPAQPGETVTGTRVDVSIDQVIAALGRRNPSVDDSPKDFRVGFIVLVKQGRQADADTLAKVNRIATEIETLVRRETGNRASLDTRLVGR